MFTVKIVIATHKKYQMPSSDIYLPVLVGAEGKKDSYGEQLELGYTNDNLGDNISYLNPSFCELTGLYWAWKNLNADYIGLVHYRRHFSLKKKRGFDNVLNKNELDNFIPQKKIFVPTKRNYYIETLYSHYAHTHYAIQLDITKKVIEDLYPDYIESFNKTMKKRSGYMFNMMIMEKYFFNSYCEWLFNILFEFKNRFEDPNLSSYQGRYFGRISEILLNVWLDYQIGNRIINENEVMEIPYIHMEKINWLKKGCAFLKAKFWGKKYDVSF